jgi:hypothetical protein
MLNLERLSSSALEKIDIQPNSWVKLRCNASMASASASTLSTDNLDESGRVIPSYDLQWYKGKP